MLQSVSVGSCAIITNYTWPTT